MAEVLYRQDSNGQFVAVTPEAPVTAPEQEFYVHLADGSVVKVPASERPISAGADAPHGYYQDGSGVHLVIGVYPAN